MSAAESFLFVLAYGMVVLSLVVQGGLLLPVADLLGLRARSTV